MDEETIKNLMERIGECKRPEDEIMLYMENGVNHTIPYKNLICVNETSIESMTTVPAYDRYTVIELKSCIGFGIKYTCSPEEIKVRHFNGLSM